MASKDIPIPHTHFTNIPPDVLTNIALKTVCSPFDTPTLRDLATVHSLVLTNRIIHQSLSLKWNPHLYASIMQLMYDVDAVRRRLGSRAVVASALSSELPRRVTMLKRVRGRLHTLGDDDARDTHVNLVDLANLLLMLSEDDGKNRYQIRDILGPSGLADLCFSLLSKNNQAGVSRPDIAFVVALMWLNSEDAIMNEDPERLENILDFLQPFVLGHRTDGSSTPVFQYFGLHCALDLPSTTPFARLCTVKQYELTRRRKNIAPNGSSNRPSRTSSDRFDDQFTRYLKIYSGASDGAGSLPLPQNGKGRTFESNWTGEWCLPCPINATEILVTTQAMQCHLREYICTNAESSVPWASSDDDDDALSRAWFPESVRFEETTNSLRIYDPMTARWFSYEPTSELVKPSDVVDKILFGETEPNHASRFGEYKFHGRVRHSDGKIALVRCPATLPFDDYGLGIWCFYGDIYGQIDLVGEWMNTSSAKDVPAGHGWFHLVKALY